MSFARQQLLAGAHMTNPPPPGMGQPPPSIQQQLERLPVEQLEKMLTEEESFRQFITQLIADGSSAKALQDIQERNRGLAQENLDLQAAIEEARNHLKVVKSSEFSAARATFAELQKRQADVLATLSPSVLLAALSKDADQADERSSQQMDSFLLGSTSLEAFVEQYIAQRTQYHMLDLKRQVAQQSMGTV